MHTTSNRNYSLPTLRQFVRHALTALVLWCPVSLALTPTLAGAMDHRTWDEVLRQHVSEDGTVAYRDLARQSRDKLDAYLALLAKADPSSMSAKEGLAFWINAYNAMVVAGVLDGYHAESTFGRYQFFKRYQREVAGQQRTLDQIEHQIIRPEFRDLRAHFAVNCASTSCPVLRHEAYVAARLEAQLDDQGRRFLGDTQRNRIDVAAGTVELSRIFEWFAEDFVAAGKTLADSLGPFVAEPQAALLQRATIGYLEYDWAMNAQPGQRP